MNVLRVVLTTMVLVLGAGMLTMPPAEPSQGTLLLAAAQVPPTVPPAEPPADPGRQSPLTIETDQTGAATGWGPTAVWIAIGMVALVLIAVAVIFSLRGGGRTVLKE